jgi:hypothetical protein
VSEHLLEEYRAAGIDPDWVAENVRISRAQAEQVQRDLLDHARAQERGLFAQEQEAVATRQAQIDAARQAYLEGAPGDQVAEWLRANVDAAAAAEFVTEWSADVEPERTPSQWLDDRDLERVEQELALDRAAIAIEQGRIEQDQRAFDEYAARVHGKLAGKSGLVATAATQHFTVEMEAAAAEGRVADAEQVMDAAVARAQAQEHVANVARLHAEHAAPFRSTLQRDAMVAGLSAFAQDTGETLEARREAAIQQREVELYRQNEELVDRRLTPAPTMQEEAAAEGERFTRRERTWQDGFVRPNTRELRERQKAKRAEEPALIVAKLEENPRDAFNVAGAESEARARARETKPEPVAAAAGYKSPRHWWTDAGEEPAA